MLTSLWMGGRLKKLRGIVFGDFRLPKDDEENPDPLDFTMDQVLDNLKMWTKIPIYTGLYTGHIKDKLTLPIGAMVEMDADARRLRVLD